MRVTIDALTLRQSGVRRTEAPSTFGMNTLDADSPSRTQRVPINRLGSLVLFGLVAVFADGCSARGRTSSPEPGSIAVLNNSGRHLDRVSLRAVPNRAGMPVRMGSIAPVPKGTIQAVERPTPRPPLPRRLTVRWIVNAQEQYEREISL